VSAPRKLLASLLAAFACLLAFAAAGAAAFGIEKWDGFIAADETKTTAATQAGSHPYEFETEIRFPLKKGSAQNEGDVKDAIVDLPAGLTFNPEATPKCTTADLLVTIFEGYGCSDEAAIGVATVRIGGGLEKAVVPVYNMEPILGQPARLGFKVIYPVIFIEPRIRSEGDYGTTVELLETSQAVGVAGTEIRLWGVPHDESHDGERGNCASFAAKYGGSCPVGFSAEDLPVGYEGPLPTPLITMQSRCSGPLEFPVRLDFWQQPGVFYKAIFTSHDAAGNPVGVSGCEGLPFVPELETRMSTDAAETGSGLEVRLGFVDQGLLNPDYEDARAQSTTEKAVVTLPEGVTINPSVGEGLVACTPAQEARETLDSRPNEGCPEASKLGALTVHSPLIDEPVEGAVFLAQQDDPATTEPGAENPFDSLIALYLVLRNSERGVLVKRPMKVEPDERTGQLVSTVEGIPQIPFSSFEFKFREGARAPLVSPPACGTYRTEGLFYPHSDPDRPRPATSKFEITEGLGGGPCPPGGVPPFNPGFEAGSLNNNAGSFSPFSMRLVRHDGEQDLTKFSSVLPPGVLGSLAGVSKCPEAAVPLAKTKTAREEIAAPSCPANSLIGQTLAGAGVGGAITYVPGQLYLAGPYKGAPLSVVSITPALAGPFDAGTVVVRLGLTLNPRTAEVEVDGAASDPIPHILKGIVLKVREIRVAVDRPNFTLNPTSCDPSSARATLFGSFLDVFDPADDLPVALASRYQAANCLNLGFKPRLGLKLKGGARRGAFPALRAVYTPRSGDANLSRLALTFPTSEFIEQGHFRTICTRVQFAAGSGHGSSCPKGAIYGHATVWTPLLDEPLSGPVYLRSSNHNLPDAVLVLHGIVDLEVAVRIDSTRGRLRAIVGNTPDAPVSRAVVQMQGGQKGLFVNSRHLCRKQRRNRARVDAGAQNGRRSIAKPLMRALACQRKAKRARVSRARVVPGSER
jgi:hypothetical protein